MNNKSMAFGFMLAVMTTGGGLTAQAAVQTQGQTTYSTQSQSAQVTGPGSASQNQSSNMSSYQSESSDTTSRTSVLNTNQSSLAIFGDQTIKSGPGKSRQHAKDVATSLQVKATANNSVQIENGNHLNSSQQHWTRTSNGTKLSQDSSEVIQSSQTQTLIPKSNNLDQSNSNQSSIQSQSLKFSYVAVNQQTNTTGWSQSLIQLQSTYSRNQVAGYGVFDMNGNLLSDSYGMFPNNQNNHTSHYEDFAPNMPVNVVVRAVNAWGQPLSNSNPVLLYLRTNNTNGIFENPSNNYTIGSIVLPAGSNGVTVSYVNTAGISLYDILDASLNVPYVYHPPIKVQNQGIESKQTQCASFDNGSNSQSESGFITSGQLQDLSGLLTTQNASNSQRLDISQGQKLKSGESNASEHQRSILYSTQSTNNTGATNQSLSGKSTQSETASLAGLKNLSQSQSVLVNGSIINVWFQQTNTSDGNSVNLNQSIQVQDPTQSSTPGSQVVNVILPNNQTQQYHLNSDSPITFTESQSVGSTNPSTVNQTISMDYTSNGAKRRVILS